MSGDKRYDRRYFETWYRGGGTSRAVLKRKVALAVALVERVLHRPITSVLDVGCGEGRWQPELYALRPRASYLGIDPSPYVVERFGERRNLRSGSFGALGLHAFDRPFDLVVCSDVLHYLERSEIEAGLPALVERVDGVALLDVFTRSDDVEGDMVSFRRRHASDYRGMFRAAGLVPLGMQHWVPAWRLEDLDALDLPSPA